MLSRDNLELWLYRLFLKLAIPKDRFPRSYELIYSPWNLSVYIRLFVHLNEIGYPAHWLSAILSNICSGAISTRARPPRSEPLKISESKADMPVLKQSTTPFVAEMTTLLSMYQVALPFAVVSNQLLRIDSIRKYVLRLDKAPLEPCCEPPSFVLGFFDRKLLPPTIPDLRAYLLGDETSDRPPDIRERGLHVLTTWIWSRAEKTISFWFPQDVMEDMKRGKWAISIWRTDIWHFQHRLEEMSKVQDTGIRWVSE